MTDKPIRVTVEDLLTGEKETAEIIDNYVIICAGRRYQSSIQHYPSSGTDVVTIKTRKADHS
jgi:hypothetical protein